MARTRIPNEEWAARELLRKELEAASLRHAATPAQAEAARRYYAKLGARREYARARRDAQRDRIDKGAPAHAFSARDMDFVKRAAQRCAEELAATQRGSPSYAVQERMWFAEEVNTDRWLD